MTSPNNSRFERRGCERCVPRTGSLIFLFGEITLMRTDRILGGLWLVLCGYSSVLLLWPLSSLFASPRLRPTPELGLGLLLAAIFISGAVASVFLFRGARWARRYVGGIAFFTVILHVVQTTVGRAISVASLTFTLLALVSGVLLFSPRREAVA